MRVNNTLTLMGGKSLGPTTTKRCIDPMDPILFPYQSEGLFTLVKLESADEANV